MEGSVVSRDGAGVVDDFGRRISLDGELHDGARGNRAEDTVLPDKQWLGGQGVGSGNIAKLLL